MGAGRPTRSDIRQNMVELLAHLGEAYGYDLFKLYKEIFPLATQRVIYYHLKKGVELGEFKVNKIVKEEGTFSWGGHTQKVYYGLGDRAQVKGNQEVQTILEEKGLLQTTKA
jgi:hypothetical protein|tara:strand:+ start:182 stop:517 length:336 start_codon:yes stop_codon:yes gene_type:complete